MTARILPLTLSVLLFPLGYWVGHQRSAASSSSTPAVTATPASSASPLASSSTLPRVGGYNAEIDRIVSEILAAKPTNFEHDLARHAEGLFYLLFETYALENPRDAARLAVQIENEGRRKYALEEAGKNWGEREPQAAFAWLTQLNPSDYKFAFDAVYSRVASKDPVFAASQLHTVTDPEIRTEAIHRAATEWARVDPKAAFAWLEQFPDAAERSLAHKAALQSHVIASPHQAFPILQALPEGNTKRELAKTFGASLASDDLETSLVWARDIKDPSLKTFVLEGISSELDVVLSDGLYSSELKNLPISQAPSFIDVLLPLTQRSFAQAAAGLPNLPPAKAEFLAERIVGYWSQENPVAARQWAQTLPPGPLRDTALQVIAQNNRPPATE